MVPSHPAITNSSRDSMTGQEPQYDTDIASPAQRAAMDHKIASKARRQNLRRPKLRIITTRRLCSRK